ncbi:flavodoxin family protein [Actinomadura sp. HBU206391]|uniref:flavodoxin family protein n=1 Tax=Actinomadura sp. HBU206391 TaxID=2731692 RepID=UPI00164F98D9|nr:flavodoxin family protein [Actinomadura sp. HBU206391]MBC6461811.1 flavodoxin family protein [Actinomadura sp. HBU206391]
MNILIVAESCFGNTLTVARAVGSGLARALGEESITVLRPGEAPRELRSDIGLLLVGAPTHGFSMPRRQSREQAAEKGATGSDSVGVREWIAQVTAREDLRAVTFDTSVKMRFSPGSASKSAAKALKKRGFPQAERGQSFYVTGTAGPLADGEEQRAEAWGAQLAGALSEDGGGSR